jgi:hypothetical protein
MYDSCSKDDERPLGPKTVTFAMSGDCYIGDRERIDHERVGRAAGKRVRSGEHTSMVRSIKIKIRTRGKN